MQFTRYQIATFILVCFFIASCRGGEGLDAKISASNTSIDPGAKIGVSVNVVSSGEVQYEWETTGGSLSELDSQATIFTAPEEEGPVVISVTVKKGDDVKTDSITLVVPSPTPTDTPSPTSTSTPTMTPSPTYTPTPPITPTSTLTPVPTDTPPPSPVPSPIACERSEIVPGIFGQVADQATYSFTGSGGTSFACAGVYDRFHNKAPAVSINYHGDPGSYAFFSIGFQEGQNFSGNEICVWLSADEQGQQFDLKLKDFAGEEQGNLLTSTAIGEWEEHCVDLDGYPDVNLSEISVMTLSFNDAFGAAEVWVDDFELR